MYADDDTHAECPGSLAVSLSVFTAAIGNLVWATYSGYCARPYRRPFATPADGRRARRRPAADLPGVAPAAARGLARGRAGALGARAARVARVLQAFGASAGMSVGAAVVGDVYALAERGAAMGVFFGVRAPH